MNSLLEMFIKNTSKNQKLDFLQWLVNQEKVDKESLEYVLTNIGENLEFLSYLKNNKPKLYNMIRNLRSEEKRWKTDAAAEMGDLGFD
jgi:hypothetical protein